MGYTRIKGASNVSTTAFTIERQAIASDKTFQGGAAAFTADADFQMTNFLA